MIRLALVVIFTLFQVPPAVPASPDGREVLKHSARLEGQFLIAAPGMTDPRFRESVILVVDHDREGAMGLIINRPMVEFPLAHLLGNEDEGGPSITVYFGGPVDPDLSFVMHGPGFESDDTIRIVEGVFMSKMGDILERVLVGEGPNVFRVMSGYAGWGPGQLEAEMARGDWITAPADAATLFDPDDENKWKKAREKGGIAL